MKKEIVFTYEEYASIAELSAADHELLELARQAVEHASAQFSHFLVGAAARLSDGTLVMSSNKENMSIISCAEQNLLLSLHSTKPEFTITSLAVSYRNSNSGATSDYPITPCGKCRQLLLEAECAAQTPMRVLMAGQSGKVFVANSVHSMLPLAFDDAYFK